MSKKEHTGAHLDDACEPCLEYRQQWSSAGGAHAALKDVVELLEKRAAEAFVRREHQTANDRLKLADEVKALQKKASERLEVFIDGRR